jgi:Domain of unknown function (DUF3784)
MYIYVNVLMTIIVLLFIASGILLKYGKHYWIISGYRTPEEIRKEGVDIAGLGNFIGASCFVIAALLLLAGIFDHYHVFGGLVGSISSLFFVVAFILIRAQKYNRRVLPDGRKRKGTKVLLGIVVAILMIVGGMLIYGSIEQSVDVEHGAIEIGGLYGTTLDISNISDVSIINELPKIQAKKGGFDFANVLKGDFSLDGIGEGKLYVNIAAPPFIKIKYNDTFVILNFRDTTTTLTTFDKINELRKIE